MAFEKKRFHLFNQGVLIAIGLLIIQQLIVASSTIWITRLIAQIQQGNFSYKFLGFYLASLFLPYFPGAAALIEMAKAKAWANIQYINIFSSVYHGQIVKWTNSSHHSTLSSILTGEAPQTINGYLDYLYYFASCGLNVFFNLIILVFIVEPLLLISYATGILLAFLILKTQKKWKRILSIRAQQGRIKWTSMLLKAWDNILLGNSYNFNIWQKKTDKRGKRLSANSIKLESLSQGVSMGMAFVLLGPSFALICYLPMMYEYNLTTLAIMIVALPGLFQMSTYSYEMLFVLADFPMQKSRMNTVRNLLDSSDFPQIEQSYDKLEKRVHWDKIRVSCHETEIPSKTIIESLPCQGRYTIKGENGSGKSSLLLLFKLMKGGEAFYLPAKHELAFQLSKDGFSRGQLVQKTLQEILEKLDASIVLLDEWDANLDTFNQQQLSRLIDKISQKKCVIEVRHR
ncbi:MAG: ABC transporter ATP-binding protein/permease [Chlamydiia bacterium]|nr:ABC transporter ATP-binding protein/permease [Chlamydiia bacterium]